MGDGVATKAVAARPTITVPPRSSFESFFASGCFPGSSPGPMTLVSSFFSEPDHCSFSHLLAGAMASPIPKPESFSFSGGGDGGGGGGNGGAEEVSGYKQKRPLELVVAQSPLFMVPPGLSPSGLLDSPLQTLAAAPTEVSQDQSHSLADENLLCNSAGMLPEPDTVRTEIPEICQSDRKAVVSSLQKLEFDGYNWRKYGQKQVKASEYPRSYYKCTHLGCPVKKKVERSRHGHVTEITYKGQHNHDPPLSNKRARDGSGPVQTSSSHVNPRHSSQDQTSSITCGLTFLALQDGQLPNRQHPVTSEDDGSQEYSVSVNVDDDNDQPNAKRMCVEEAPGVSGHTSTHITVTESRIIVQTRSEVDLLDDGYKWRKYGQKVVKGNPYPRSYYRCTHAECKVRKHVERASTDSKNVITTYEGKHNHVIPAAKNSGSSASRSSNFVQLNTNAGKPSLHTGMDFESKDQIPIVPRVKGGAIAA